MLRSLREGKDLVLVVSLTGFQVPSQVAIHCLLLSRRQTPWLRLRQLHCAVGSMITLEVAPALKPKPLTNAEQSWHSGFAVLLLLQ